MNGFSRHGDQADALRLMTRAHAGPSCGLPALLPESGGTCARVIAVTSGRSGAGTSSVAVNLAVVLSQRGERVLVIDADPGPGSIDQLLGLNPVHTLNDLSSSALRLADLIMQGPEGISLIPAGSGGEEHSHLAAGVESRILHDLRGLEKEFDSIIIDTGTGISPYASGFTAAARDIVLVISPEPVSITSGYARIKFLATRYHDRHYRVLVNMVQRGEEGETVFRNLSRVTGRFLHVPVDFAGSVVHERRLADAAMLRRAVIELHLQAEASRCFHGLARTMGGQVPQPLQAQEPAGSQCIFSRYFEPAHATRCI